MRKLATIGLAALVLGCAALPSLETGSPPLTAAVNEQEAAKPVPVVAEAPKASPEPPTKTSSAKFLWPARGRIIAGFGKRPDGMFNEGINIAVPQGTEIRATESGRVAYAGDELKGYGNLVLIRHANGWVSAYAHADQILVKRDDEVKRGQVIARAGKTGSVDQPQLHFELRDNSRPVDPVPHLAN
jgi:murein DD-endopeptidase MepM/ murein hydrolase activator NlpD